MKKNLTPTQAKLLELIQPYISVNCPVKYDILKSLVDFSSFESTFNALLSKGYVDHHKTDDFSNQFKLVA